MIDYSNLENCEECESENIELFDLGTYKRHYWYSWKCNDCGHYTSNEPDYDNLPGGKDWD